MKQVIRSKTVGRIAGLWRYPVKSMGAEPLEDVDVSWFGLAGDRRWALVRKDAMGSGFPWLTIRECSNMQHYRPVFADPARPDKSPVVVRTPSGAIFDVDAPELGEALYSKGVAAIKQDRGIFDTFPVSLITTQTIAKLGDLVGDELDVQRFRPNLLVEASEDEPFPEDQWVGGILRVGSIRLRVDKRDGRCAVITVDPSTTKRDPKILRTVVSERQGCLGVYGTVVQPGRVALGDRIYLEPGSALP